MASQQVAVIDIGSDSIRAAIALADTTTRTARVLGFAETPSAGIVHGHVVDIKAVRQCLQTAINGAEDSAGNRMGQAYIGFSGSHLQSVISTAERPQSRARPVTAADMEKTVQQARQIQLRENCQVVHAIPGAWALDKRIRVKDPRGMQATSLSLESLVVSGNSSIIGNLGHCLVDLNLEALEFVVSSLAVSRLALSREEIDMGVALMDIGAGTTELVVMQNSQVQLVRSIDYGGANFTRELATLMHCPWEEAERVKCSFGSALPASEPKTAIRALAFGDQGELTFSRRFLTEILAARLQKLWDEIEVVLRQAGLRNSLTAGLVLTGGSSQIARLQDSCRAHFKLPVRRAEIPRDLPIDELPIGMSMALHGVLLGLIHWGTVEMREEQGSDVQIQSAGKDGLHPLRRLFAPFLPDHGD